MSAPDYYEILQVNQKADAQTIERVFRHLAKQFHPDNKDTGDSDRFNLVVEAFRVLSDAEARVAYDIRYDDVRREEWKVLDQASAGDNVEADRRIRIGILTLLYTTRRKDVKNPGLGSYELEQTLGCLEHIMDFHLWYLKETGWVERLPNGQYAITVAGIDKLNQTDIPWRANSTALLAPGSGEESDEVTITPAPELSEGTVDERAPTAEDSAPADDVADEEYEEFEEEEPIRSRVIA